MRTKLMMLMLVLLGVMASREAQAFYNPSTGRWLNRDPLADEAVLRAQQQIQPDRFYQLWIESLQPAYVFVRNSPANLIEPLGLHVYKVQLPSSVSGSVDHRQAVGDDGLGGSYILEFYPKNKGGCRCSGAALVAPGEVSVTRIKNKTAADYIKANGLTIKDTVDTSGTLVDGDLAAAADGFANGKAPTYVLLFNDCGTIANSWLKNARAAVKDWNPIPPGTIPPLPFNY